ncbi:hypothetical protein DNI29_11180 [Hymenobacter sediminis]|uniref:tetratricopeptide repeat protein n=1 Tax=Hymenobacter sediminis TaxID=2218621 RepID=UPI000DA6C893|nr:tetratricopeptide repeat protein [Hymenobacter sediminis]RPD47985.1 hypothetical protein DNI29_11180 [Hymenobacter sediminis]
MIQRYFSLLAGLLLAAPTLAQQKPLAQRTADHACSCIGTQVPTDTVLARLDKCLPQALTSVTSDGWAADGNAISTVEGMTSTLRQSRELLISSCPPVRNALVTRKTEEQYQLSAVPAARQAYEQGATLLKQKQYAQALPLFLQAAKQDPKFVMALDNAAICYRQTKDLKKAAAFYTKSLAVFPEGHLALLNMAVVQSMLEKPTEARSYYEQLRFVAPYNPEGYFGAGRLALLRQDFPQAMANLFAAHRLYVDQESPYLDDSSSMVSLLYKAMKEKGQLDQFRTTAKEYHLTINE